MLIWCLKPVKHYLYVFNTLKFFLFRKRNFEFLYHDTFLFPLGGCVDEAVNINKGYKYVYFVQS